MKNDIAKILLLIFLLIGCRSWGGRPEDKKPDPRDTVQKPLPDSILVRDTAIKAYINWGTTEGRCCYGIRGIGGTTEYKNSSCSWTREDEMVINEIRKRKGGTP